MVNLDTLYLISQVKYLGIFLIALGLAMFIVGVGAFASQGKMNFILTNFGEFSFKFWLPTIIIGSIVLALSNKK